MLGSQRTGNCHGMVFWVEEISFLESGRKRKVFLGDLDNVSFFPPTEEDVPFWLLGFVNEVREPDQMTKHLRHNIT